MRIALVSDIHGNLLALENVLLDIERRGVDHIVNLGDSLSGPLLPRETAHFLMAQSWTHLAGNHERQLLNVSEASGPSDVYARSQLTATELDWIAGLAPVCRFSETVFFCHGTPRRDDEYFLESVDPGGARPARAWEIEARLDGVDAELVACGHTHVPRCLRAANGCLLVNPGSVGLPAYEDDDPFPHRIETGSSDARYAIVERRRDGWRAELIAVPYDCRGMAELARERGRDDWAFALCHGYAGPASLRRA